VPEGRAGKCPEERGIETALGGKPLGRADRRRIGAVLSDGDHFSQAWTRGNSPILEVGGGGLQGYTKREIGEARAGARSARFRLLGRVSGIGIERMQSERLVAPGDFRENRRRSGREAWFRQRG